MTDIPEDPRALLNQMSALAAELPGCEECGAQRQLVKNQGVYIHRVSHDDDCSWARENLPGFPDGMCITQTEFSREQLAEVQRERNSES